MTLRPSDLPGDEPKVVKPARPLSLPPTALRKKEAVEPARRRSQDDSGAACSDRGRSRSRGRLTTTSLHPADPRLDLPDPTDDLAATPDFRPTGNAKNSAVVKSDDEDDEPLPGTASVRRARRTVRSTENVRHAAVDWRRVESGPGPDAGMGLPDEHQSEASILLRDDRPEQRRRGGAERLRALPVAGRLQDRQRRPEAGSGRRNDAMGARHARTEAGAANQSGNGRRPSRRTRLQGDRHRHDSLDYAS